MQSKRTQAERSAATRTALVAAARPLFAARGYAAVGTEELVRAAGVTRGALYHQFAGKEELFAAVFEQVEAEVAERIGRVLGGGGGGAGAGPADPGAALRAGVAAWLDAVDDPEIQRIVLIDAPAVLGWDRWREVALRYAGGMVEAVLQAGMDAGRLAPRPVEPLAHVLLGALDEAALYVAQSADRAAARAAVEDVLGAILAGLGTSGGAPGM
jgi:AcrR family transcriptional regulator